MIQPNGPANDESITPSDATVCSPSARVIYANENDERIAYWLSRLPLPIDTIDIRSIEDIDPHDIINASQFHTFAGIGGWLYALHLAGWPSDVCVWSGSCPCQPFSSAGRGMGEDDERHLWPEFRRLINDCRPPIIFGEQTASLAGRDWLARVRADLEVMGYGVGAADLCAACVGSPQRRQRLWWVAYARREQRDTRCRLRRWVESPEWSQPIVDLEPNGGYDWVGNPQVHDTGARWQPEESRCWWNVDRGSSSDGDGLARTMRKGSQKRERRTTPGPAGCAESGETVEPCNRLGDTESGGQPIGGPQTLPRRLRYVDRTGQGYWRRADYLYCTDGKYRAVEPGSEPLANGIPGRVAQLHGLGNAIVPQLAARFIRSSVQAIVGLP